MATTLETRRAGPALRMKMNGITTGKVEKNTRRKTPMAPNQSSMCRRARSGGSGSCFNRSCIVSSSAGCRMDAITGGNVPADEPSGLLRIDGFAHSVKREQSSSLFREAAHQIKHSVNNSPRQIAAQRTNKHRADALATCFRHTERPSESKDHDQTEEDFGDTINRIQHALGGPFEGAFRHGALEVEPLTRSSV